MVLEVVCKNIETPFLIEVAERLKGSIVAYFTTYSHQKQNSVYNNMVVIDSEERFHFFNGDEIITMRLTP